mgnify:CR=1 FL=1
MLLSVFMDVQCRFDHMALRSANSVSPLAFLLGFSGLTLSVLDPVRDHRSIGLSSSKKPVIRYNPLRFGKDPPPPGGVRSTKVPYHRFLRG